MGDKLRHAMMRRVSELDRFQQGVMLLETVGQIVCMLDNEDDITADMHPADVLAKHIQRGNMAGDGVDIVRRGEVKRLEKRITELESDVAQAQLTITTLESDLDDARDRVMALESELEEVRDGAMGEDL